MKLFLAKNEIGLLEKENIDIKCKSFVPQLSTFLEDNQVQI